MCKQKDNQINNTKIEDLVDASLDKIKSMIDVNCVIGNPITLPDDSTIIPISKVSVGFVSGGGEYSDLGARRGKPEFPMAGGTGGGFSVSPMGFFVIDKKSFKLIRADKSSAYMGLIKNATEALKKMMEKK